MRFVRQLLVACSLAAVAQREARPQPAVASPVQAGDTSSRRVQGRVVNGTRDDRAVGGTRVVLHRVASSGAGPVDSVLTSPSGAYSFTYTRIPGALYLLSVQYAGIAYFSTPLTAEDPPPTEPVDVVVYDTSSAPSRVRVRGRHVIVSHPDAAGLRAVVEVFDLANDSSVTSISSSGGVPTFHTRLPATALKPRLGEGTFAPDAVTFSSGEARLFAPMPPGLKQLVVSYELPSTAFPLSMSVEQRSDVLEVLVEELAGRVEGARLQAQSSVTVSGRRFMRSLSQSVDSAAVFTIALPAVTVTRTAPNAWLLAPLFLLVVLGIWWFARRGQSPRSVTPAVAPPVAPADPRESLAARIATLDALLDVGSSLDPKTRAMYAEERAQAMEQLRAVLAAGA